MSKFWDQISFLVEPEMLRELLEEFRPDLFPGGFVPEDFSPQNYEPFVQEYSRALESIVDSNASQGLPLARLHAHGTPYRILEARGPGQFYVECPAPTVILRGEGIRYDLERGRLVTNCIPSLFFGLQLHCRKADASVSGPGSDQELFRAMESWIKAHTVPLTLASSEKVHRTRIRLSANMRANRYVHQGLSVLGLVIR